MIAVLVGMLVRNTLGRPDAARVGLALSLRSAAPARYRATGSSGHDGRAIRDRAAGLVLIVAAVASTVLITWQFGRWLGVAPGLSLLIATGTGICGASAIVAANTVVKDSDESVAYALATVTLFGPLPCLLSRTGRRLGACQ